MNNENLSADELIDIGMQEYMSGNVHGAHAYYDLALQKEPNNFDALHLMGILASSVGDLEAAESLITLALQVNPNFCDAYINLGNVMAKMDKYNESVSLYYQALQVDSSNLKAHSNLAAVLNKLGRYAEAERILAAALALEPDSWEANFNLADCYKYMKQYEQSITYYARSLQLNPDYGDSYFQLANVLCEIGQFDRAKRFYENAIALSPANADYYKNLGSCLNHLCDTDGAIQALAKVLELDDQKTSSYTNLGLVYRENNDLKNAEHYYEKALQFDRTHADTRYSLGIVKLLGGEFKQGWELFEERFNPGKPEHLLLPTTNIARWHGEPLDGKSIILWGEQGLGDHIQFARYASLLAQTAARVAIVTRKELVGVFENSPFFANIDIYYDFDSLDANAYDYYTPAISAGMYLDINAHIIPAKQGYLQADAIKSDGFKKLFDECKNELKIGIVWQGSRHIPWADKLRSVTLESFAKLADLDEIKLFSLQKGIGEEQLEQCSFKDKIIDLSPHIHDMSDTLALIDSLDVVISVDTSVAHLSAASGKPTWILLQFANCWRWGLGGEDSYWYDSVRLFRQNKKGDWNQVFTNIEKAIIALKNNEG